MELIMANEYRNAPWFISTNTTAAGIALEKQETTFDASAIGFAQRRFRLRGYSVSGSTVVAISTTPIKILFGRSSEDATVTEVANEPGASMVGVAGIVGIEGEYIAIETTVAHADGGLTFSLWGD